MITTRRFFLAGVTAFLAAPAIVRVSSLMPVAPFDPVKFEFSGYYSTLPVGEVDRDVLALLNARMKDAWDAMVAGLYSEPLGDMRLPD